MITIGMPLFNAEDFLEEALDSLLAQSFCDFKLIISDNASADGTEHICRRYAKADSRITYTRQASNQGGIANFCSVLKAADTPYFMWAAGDDIWAPEYIEMCIANLQADPELGLVASIWFHLLMMYTAVPGTRLSPCLPTDRGKHDITI